MGKVNIVTATTCKGPAKQEAAGKWLVEYINGNEIETKDGFLYRESTTGNELTLQLLANAVYLIGQSKEEFDTVECRIDSDVIASAFMNKWIDKWMENEWKTAKGNDVANSELWKQLYSIMNATSKRFIVTNYRSRYTDWMIFEAQRHLDVIKAKRDLHERFENKEEEKNV